MGDLSANFSRAEFQCRCCGRAEIDPSLITGLQALREALGVPISILSGYRCAKHNREVGGAKRSQHLLGRAADICAGGMTARQLYAAAVKIPQFRGFGVDDERRFLHVDTRPASKRWCYRAGREINWYDIPAKS